VNEFCCYPTTWIKGHKQNKRTTHIQHALEIRILESLIHRQLDNITPEKMRSQMRVINEDFTKQNSDHFKTPPEFTDLVANIGIEFELATLDPEGNPTTGVTRTYSELSGWDGYDEELPIEQ